MSKPGPKRTATPILAMRGSHRAADRAAVEPKVPDGQPPCPKSLTPAARRKWRELVSVLSECGILTRVDADVLEVYCATFARWREACAEVAKIGQWADSKQGLCETAASRIAKTLTTELRHLMSLLGLSPAARAGLDVRPLAERGEKPRDLKAFAGGA